MSQSQNELIKGQGIEWRPVVGFEGLYEVSNCGQLKSLNYNHTKKEGILKLYTKHLGYKAVSLVKDKSHYTKAIHRLVAEAFIPNPYNKPEVNHIDSNPSNNHLSNLEWVTKSENAIHGFRFGNRKNHLPIPPKRGKSPEAKPVYQFTLDGVLIRKWDCITDAYDGKAKASHIGACCKGIRFKALGYRWSFTETLVDYKLKRESGMAYKVSCHLKIHGAINIEDAKSLYGASPRVLSTIIWGLRKKGWDIMTSSCIGGNNISVCQYYLSPEYIQSLKEVA
jgi:hypothetical protein